MALVTIEEVIRTFNEADKSIKSVFQKVDPVLVVGLIFDHNAGKERLYTLEMRIKEGQNLDDIRDHIVRETGMAPGFYLGGTKIVVTQKLDLKVLKIINDFEEILEIKGSPYGAGGSSDF
jgi:hypothetical protein